MNHRFKYQPIVLALLVTLIMAGLFYLPYLSVRNKTIDTFRTQQAFLARQAGAGLQAYFAAYEKALTFKPELGKKQREEAQEQLKVLKTG